MEQAGGSGRASFDYVHRQATDGVGVVGSVQSEASGADPISEMGAGESAGRGAFAQREGVHENVRALPRASRTSGTRFRQMRRGVPRGLRIRWALAERGLGGGTRSLGGRARSGMVALKTPP